MYNSNNNKVEFFKENTQIETLKFLTNDFPMCKYFHRGKGVWLFFKFSPKNTRSFNNDDDGRTFSFLTHSIILVMLDI